LSNPTRSGYTFGGWYSNIALTSPKSGISSTDTGAKTFYAKWNSSSSHSVDFLENNYVTFIPDPDYNSMVSWGYEGFTTIVPHGSYINIEYSAKVASSGIRITVNGNITSSRYLVVNNDMTISATYVGTNSISNMSLIITEEVIDGEITWNVDVEEE
jgi:uncharacterized repeat protein (TIGR02543 family)